MELSQREYFEQVAGALDWPERLETARRQGRKTVAIIGVSVPEELFWACGATPISLSRLVAPVESIAGPSWEDPCAPIPRSAFRLPPSPIHPSSFILHPSPSHPSPLPLDACAAVRSAFDLLANRWIPAGLIDAVVVAGGCDWTARLGDLLEKHILVWPLNVMRGGEWEVGGGRRSRNRVSAQVMGSLDAMLTSLELLTDLPLTRRAFVEASKRMAALEVLDARLDRLRAEHPSVLCASEYYRIVGALDLADPDHWTHAVQEALSAYQSAFRIPQSAMALPRILLTGCPTGFPDVSLVEMIERAGFQIVGDDFVAHRRGVEASRAQSKLGGSLSRRGILEWTARTLSLWPRDVGETPQIRREVEGVIRIYYRGCALTAAEPACAPPVTSQSAVPTLTLEVDQLPPGSETLRTRLEAFHEQLVA